MTDEHRKVHKRKRPDPESAAEDQVSNGKPNSNHKKEKKSDLRGSKQDRDAPVEKDTKNGNEKHSRVRNKFQKSSQITQKVREIQKARGEDEVVVEEPKEFHGLVSLPQPARVEDDDAPIAKALPDWLSRPIKASASDELPLGAFALEETLRSNLKAAGIDNAFAIQSKVLPLLLPGSSHHDGDICVSAATGSGKTLSYTLPMVQRLSGRAHTRLRGVIVVPTRELVKQVRDVFLQCTPRSGLQIGIAAGNRTLKQEKKALIRKDFKYDPAVALRPIDERQQKIESYMDWDSGASDGEDGPPPFGHVKDFQSAVDILICTPGRLVDHVRSTNGFTLDYVEWLVIDEADRLLDSSFQQWVDVIVPALEKMETKPKDIENLQKYFLIRPQRNVQKVILSATMTENISKLMKLRLRNPVLVALEGLSNGLAAQANDEAASAGLDLRMPEKLQEVAVAVHKADEKPLVLIKTLRHYAQNAIKTEQMKAAGGRNHDDVFDSEGDSSSEDKDEKFDDYASDDSSELDEANNSASDTDSESDTSSTTSGSDRPIEEPAKRDVVQGAANGTKKPLHGVLVFTNTNESALRLTRLIALVAPELASSVLSTTKSTAAYGGSKALRAFKSGKISVLVATDRASRGLDIQNLACVINYDIPTSLSNYVHRTGRTARAGNEGLAVTLVSHHEGRWFWSEIGRNEKVKRHDKIQRQEKLQDEVSEQDREALADALSTLQAEATGRQKQVRNTT